MAETVSLGGRVFAEKPVVFGIRGVLRRHREHTADALVGRDREFREAVRDAVIEEFRADDPDGGLLALLQWIVDHQEQIIALVKALMVLFV